MIETAFDIPFVSSLASREKQIQQNYRPVIGVHKWFARRPGTLFRSLLLSEFLGEPLKETYYGSHDLKGIAVGDPFMGGGTPLFEANRLGCDVTGIDVNPMSYWIVREELQRIDIEAYKEASNGLLRAVESVVERYYKTTCVDCGVDGATVKYFLWVKNTLCGNCGFRFDLFPGHLIAKDIRHRANVFVCGSCGELNERPTRNEPGCCDGCRAKLLTRGPAIRNKCPCPSCGFINSYPDRNSGPPDHRMFAIEYHCKNCSGRVPGRLFKKPDRRDLTLYDEARTALASMNLSFAPNDEIPMGDETNRLHRWGYRRYSELFNERQLLGLELICRHAATMDDKRLKSALATNLSDLLRYQNMLCRYDPMALKSLDIFSIHGYPVGLVQCESNILGIPQSGPKGGNVGSGGWSNITDKYLKAKLFCEQPFEIEYRGRQKTVRATSGEWIGERRIDLCGGRERKIDLHCADSAQVTMSPGSLDVVLTDPPYYSNVQYAELMDFCYVWLRRLVGDIEPVFASPTTRSASELTGNITMARGLNHFSEGMSQVFSRAAHALKPGSPFAFTYHHNSIEAYVPIIIGLLDAGLVCSASMPCPSEMGGSIHINGTGSSKIDTIFVCRSTGTVRRRLIVNRQEEIDSLVREEVSQLWLANLNVTHGDIRCIAYGHLARLSVWHLRETWDRSNSIESKFAKVEAYIAENYDPPQLLKLLESAAGPHPGNDCSLILEQASAYAVKDVEIPF